MKSVWKTHEPPPPASPLTWPGLGLLTFMSYVSQGFAYLLHILHLYFTFPGVAWFVLFSHVFPVASFG